MAARNDTQLKKWLRSKFFLLGTVILAAFLGLNFYTIWHQSQTVDNEIKNLEQQVESLHKKNLELSELIEYLNSTAYVEKKARTDLGLKKPDEQTVIIPDLDAITNTKTAATTALSANTSNAAKWWHYFFAADNQTIPE